MENRGILYCYQSVSAKHDIVPKLSGLSCPSPHHRKSIWRMSSQRVYSKSRVATNVLSSVGIGSLCLRRLAI